MKGNTSYRRACPKEGNPDKGDCSKSSHHRPSPAGNLHLRSVPQSYALEGLLTNLILLVRAAFQPLSLCSFDWGGGSKLCRYRSIIRCPSSILAPSAASLSAASFPRTPVWDLTCTCSILTSVPLRRVSSRYSLLNFVASAWLLVCARPSPPRDCPPGRHVDCVCAVHKDAILSMHGPYLDHAVW